MTTIDRPSRTHEPHGDDVDPGHPRRRAVAVVSLAVVVAVLDGTIVDVVLPPLAVDPGASTRRLQWIADSFLLVITGLLLAAGGSGTDTAANIR